MTDYEIAKKVSSKNIADIIEGYPIDHDNFIPYGKDKGKIIDFSHQKKGKLILVTSTSPTPYGEGKTTLSIGINDAFKKIGKNSVVVLREPSLGPVFGTKGGATGGGMSQIIPMEDINLHFTGDMHAITSANNLLCAIIDNHIFQGNELDIEEVVFQRCMDINDRALRTISLKERVDHFNITPASEIMAILCLSKDVDDLKDKLGNILIGYNSQGKEIYARELHCIDAIAIVLKDAIHPNVVQTLEHNLAIAHGGPFANIAHGCSSIRSINLGCSISDYVITEAGFGSDMGGMKFFDITARIGDFYPDVVVVNTTIRSLLYNGNNDLKLGISNLEFHVENMKKFCSNVIVVLNQFHDDQENDISYIKKMCHEWNVPFEVSTAYQDGSSGALSVAYKIEELLKEKTKKYEMYSLNDSIIDKMNKVLKNHLYAGEIHMKEEIVTKIKRIEKTFGHLPICIAKTQYSISDNPKLLGFPKQYDLEIKDIKVNSGAGFITVYLGNIITMPGLSKDANYLHMKYNNCEIEGLF